jgi:hypothetical protein
MDHQPTISADLRPKLLVFGSGVLTAVALIALFPRAASTATSPGAPPPPVQRPTAASAAPFEQKQPAPERRAEITPGATPAIQAALVETTGTPGTASPGYKHTRIFNNMELRGWTDRAGRRVKATLVAASPNTITLATPEGLQRTFPRAAFSPADLAYVDWEMEPTRNPDSALLAQSRAFRNGDEAAASEVRRYTAGVPAAATATLTAKRGEEVKPINSSLPPPPTNLAAPAYR